jgi:hypothetical protein
MSRRHHDPEFHEKYVERIKDEVSGISEKEAGWWIQTFNLCTSVSRACDEFFKRRGIPPHDFNSYDYDNP